MTDQKPLLQLIHVQQLYTSGRRQFVAVQDVNLTINEGEFVALLGPSGCGKSTLLRIITGLRRPSEGRVLYRGIPLEGVNPYATIVFQTFALFPWLTVQENVELALRARGVPAEERKPRALDLIDRVGLDGFETAYPRELSGGMRQKVGFARAMAVEPELLCLDEPFSALDVLSAESLRGELLELWLSGKIPTRAILMVTHNIEEAILMADRLIIMDKDPGRIVAEMPIALFHPRQRKSPEFQDLVDQVYALLAGQTQPEPIELGSAPGEPGRTRALPQITINDLAGFLEYLNEQPNYRADIFHLPEDLGVDSDHILRLTETAELLGFATIEKGDIQLTPLGETFAQASILARKEIFATRIRRLPLMRWLLNLLRRAEENTLDWEVVRTALELEFPPDEAERQLDILIDWGRYAELLAYDDNRGLLTLEPASVPERAM
ncbi:nitrate ABC transporter ATP-binding protein [Thermanaerothrix daxensis]|uniref:Nitrate ABC transporter ATP-binding protein n=1 Tax=Thermanaerothrix daxensis TaxID=869279 RepID=A0A0P6YP33_9CHLR|nr:nitrate/sulfonate/bicarbonate ABC transporter ATP-binding protein [Thermanaerothrix daxensis]KPL84629.1 nitrate ABC transporter ATP-binding protein [Thermanaerothrix daxensis]